MEIVRELEFEGELLNRKQRGIPNANTDRPNWRTEKGIEQSN